MLAGEQGGVLGLEEDGAAKAHLWGSGEGQSGEGEEGAAGNGRHDDFSLREFMGCRG